MTELVIKILSGVLRVIAIPIADWLVRHNILSSDDGVKLIAEIAAYAGVILWAVLAWIKQHRKQLTAQAMGPSSAAEVKDMVNAGHAPSLDTGSDQVPTLNAGGGK